MPSADRSASPDDREKDDGRGGNKKSASSKTAKDLSHVPCKFYKVGSCTAGSSCPFSHSLVEPGGQKDVCAWFVKGNCKFGHKCALAHVLPGQTMAMDRKNKKAAQIAAGGAKNTESKGGRGGNKRDGGNSSRNNPASSLLAGGSTAPTRARPPMNMPLKATISPSAPAPPLKDTDFTSFGVLDESSQLPTAPARNKSPSPTATKPSSPTLPVSAPRRPSVSSPTKDFGPIGSPPSSATSPSSRMHSGTPPTQANGFLSTSPFSAPGTKPPFLGYGDGGRQGMAASLGSGMAMGGGLAGWNANGNQVSSSPLRGSLLSAGRMNGRPANGDYDISIEYEQELGAKGRRKATLEDSNEDLEDFLPSSLTDLLTPEERSRRMSRTNSGQSPGVGGGFESSSPHRHGLGVPLGHNPGGGGGHRYSRSVPAPSLLGGDLKSIWSSDGPPPPHAHPQASGLPGSPMGIGPSSYSSASGFGGREFDGAPSSFAERGTLPSLSPSNASAAFLPGIHQYIARNKQQQQPAGANNGGLFASNAAAQQGPPGIAHYLQSGPSGVHNTSGTTSPYVRPNPFDLTQQLHGHNAPPGVAGHGAPMGNVPGIPGPGDTHILSPNARALQAHAPGQSLPQGLAAGYSRIHALPPLPPTAGSPSPAAFSPGTGGAAGGYNASRDWATMSTGSVSGSPGFMSFMSSTKPAPAAAPAAKSPPASAGLDSMFSQKSYSAAARTGGVPTVAAPMQRNASGGSKWQGGQPMSPLGGPSVTAPADADDDLFRLDD
ncbi:hypothetical protein MVEN_00738600 [Mycena venus]|uniref:C3H1-type domain-containing protein n=1 Tax=Mycena venus TaxID=2733690 RepID=A0A8H7D5I3_9AGAR|nr:hypothetical protein MVEN_00738600 [Mycena venus]